MNYQNTFNRYEVKYIITKAQQDAIKSAMAEHMQADKFGKSKVSNIYFDTPDKLLIRRSLEKPIYKEKLRLRSYGTVQAEETVFVELKKKYQSVVYKRRIAMTERAAMGFLCANHPSENPSQIEREINYFGQFYQALEPSVFIAYRREAFFAKEDADFRITFDENILWRDSDLSLCLKATYGEDLLQKGQVLMEVKTAFAMPLWLAAILSENRIFKTSFSKYGGAYQSLLNRNFGGGVLSA